MIHQRTRFLEHAKRANHLARHHIKPNREMNQRTLRLCAPIFIGRYFDLAHRIRFNTSVFGWLFFAPRLL